MSAKSKFVIVKYNDDSRPLELGAEGQEAKKKATAPKEPPAKPKVAEVEPMGAASAEHSSALFEKLKKAVDGTSNPFTQFKEMLASLSDIIPDEPTRFAAALRAVNRSYKYTAEQIIFAMNGRLKSLQSESKQFSESLIQDKKDLAKLESQLKDKDRSIESLTKQISQLISEKADIETGIRKKQATLQANSRDLSSAVDALKKEIEEENELVLRYLKQD